MNLNKVFLIGRIASDIELKTTQGGQSTTTINVATNRTWKDANGQKKEQAEFSRVVIWGKQAELVSQYLTKGSEIMIEGRLQTRKWDGTDGSKHYITEIVAESVQFGAKAQRSAAPVDKDLDEDGLPIIDDSAPRGTGPEINISDLPF